MSQDDKPVNFEFFEKNALQEWNFESYKEYIQIFVDRIPREPTLKNRFKHSLNYIVRTEGFSNPKKHRAIKLLREDEVRIVCIFSDSFSLMTASCRELRKDQKATLQRKEEEWPLKVSY